MLKGIENSLKIPVSYGVTVGQVKPPYIVYKGNGQEHFGADDTYYTRENGYEIEYYFTASTKSEETEKAIEDALLAGGWRYDKSEDVYISSENVFVIYYDI